MVYVKFDKSRTLSRLHGEINVQKNQYAANYNINNVGRLDSSGLVIPYLCFYRVPIDCCEYCNPKHRESILGSITGWF